MKKYLAEFTGTFLLALVVVLSRNTTPGMSEIWAFFAVLLAITYVFTPFSGGYFNPALVLGARLLRLINGMDTLYYILAQLAGALLGAMIGVFLMSCGALPRIEAFRPDNPLCGIMAEMFGTFLPGLVMYLGNREHLPGYAVAISAAFAASLVAFGPYSGGAFNPALTFAFSITGNLDSNDLWQYIIGALFGAAVAATLYQILQQQD